MKMRQMWGKDVLLKLSRLRFILFFPRYGSSNVKINWRCLHPCITSKLSSKFYRCHKCNYLCYRDGTKDKYCTFLLFFFYVFLFISITVASTSSPGPWPPDIDFSSVFYSEEVYCCLHTTSSNHMSVTTSSTVDPDSHKTPSYAKQPQRGETCHDGCNSETHRWAAFFFFFSF